MAAAAYLTGVLFTVFLLGCLLLPFAVWSPLVPERPSLADEDG